MMCALAAFPGLSLFFWTLVCLHYNMCTGANYQWRMGKVLEYSSHEWCQSRCEVGRCRGRGSTTSEESLTCAVVQSNFHPDEVKPAVWLIQTQAIHVLSSTLLNTLASVWAYAYLLLIPPPMFYLASTLMSFMRGILPGLLYSSLCTFASMYMYYSESKPKNKKLGRPGGKAVCIYWRTIMMDWVWKTLRSFCNSIWKLIVKGHIEGAAVCFCWMLYENKFNDFGPGIHLSPSPQTNVVACDCLAQIYCLHQYFLDCFLYVCVYFSVTHVQFCVVQ